MKDIQDTIYILSAERIRYSAKQNETNTNGLINALTEENIPHKTLLGSYNGVEETSVLVVGEEYESKVKLLVSLYNQECYLKSTPDRMSKLVFLNDNGIMDIGEMRGVSEAVAKQHNSWSYCFELNQYYIHKL